MQGTVPENKLRFTRNDFLWNIIMEIKQAIPFNLDEFYLTFPLTDRKVEIGISVDEPEPDKQTGILAYNCEHGMGWGMALYYAESMSWPVIERGETDEQTFVFLKRYLPYLALRLQPLHSGKAVAVGHLAMSLDGRIATKSGHSQWIGNQANRIHSHRMRALADAVLVGGSTIESDMPRLNVRHVTGEDPVKILMGNGNYDLSIYGEEEVIRVSSEPISEKGIKHIRIKKTEKGYDCRGLLALLFQEGIRMVYIEGGGITLSGFIDDRALDILQLHYAPIILGTGIPGIVLPEIHKIGEALDFDFYQMETMEDEWMFTGILNYR